MSQTPIADMVEQMLAGGSLPAMIVLAVRAVELDRVSREASADRLPTSADASADKRRERDRNYQRKKRENQRAARLSAKANDVAEQPVPVARPSADASADAPTTRCDLSFFSKERKEESATEKGSEVVERGKRGTRISPDARLSASDLQFALDAGMTRDRAMQAWSEFVDYWVSIPGQRGCKLDWPATWRNRVRELTGKGGRQQRRGSGDVHWRSGIPGVV